MPGDNNDPYGVNTQPGIGVPTTRENLVVPEAEDPHTELKTRLATVEERLNQYDKIFAQLPKTPEETPKDSTYSPPLAGQVEEQTIPEVPTIQDTAVDQTPTPAPYETTYQDPTNDPNSMQNLADRLRAGQNQRQETPLSQESVPVTPTSTPVYP